jgi:hypothetical protein
LLHKDAHYKAICSSDKIGNTKYTGWTITMILIALSLFLSSFLLFLVQPLIGKYILPWFGSSPGVWSASLLFFQVLLTGGYAYAYTLTGALRPHRQARVHWFFLGVSAAAVLLGALFWGVPLLPGSAWRPTEVDFPFWDVIKVLAVGVGIPYFLLATNSTLLQAWFNTLYPGRSPYRLYALSNLASLLGLVCYPFLLEPLLSVTTQARWWTLGYGLYIVSASVLAWRFLRAPSPAPAETDPPASANPTSAPEAVSPRWYARLLWMLLPAIASLLLLAVTNQITQEIAVIPFLWILPLTLYLLSFILCFESDRWYGRVRFTLVLVLAAVAYRMTLSGGPLVNLKIQIAAYCLLFFICCMICHGELARLRPAPKHLTSFYLTVSVGGALGGLFVNLAAPMLFVYYWELPLGLALCFAVYPVLTLLLRQGRRWITTGLLVVVQAGVLYMVVSQAIQNGVSLESNSLWLARNFYGVLRVKQFFLGDEGEQAYELVHGITLHGLQFADPAKRDMPTTYYWKGSGVGLAFEDDPNRSNGMKVGVLGLGVGTLAAYGRPGDTIRFYEINPLVIQLAQGEGGYFWYLKDSAARIEIVPGDARLSMERELEQSGSQGYDLLVLDAFNSDSIPVHLLTRQAFALYLQHLKPDGVLAVHVSNRALDLQKVVYGMADEFGMQMVPILAGSDGPGTSTSRWDLLTTNQAFLDDIAIQGYDVMTDQADPHIQLWTDDYSNLFQILH